MFIPKDESLEKDLKKIHIITQGLYLPLKTRLVSLILYANTFNDIACSDFRRLYLACISLACKIEENYYRSEKLLEHFSGYFDDFSVRKDEMFEIEMEIIKKIDFEFDILPATFVYLKLLKTCGIKDINLKKIEILELIHLDSRILDLKYFRKGLFNPADVALSLLEDSSLKYLNTSTKMFVDFCYIDKIREFFLHHAF